MFSIDNDQPIDALEHLMEILFQVGDILHDATHLDDLLVAEEVESGKLLSFFLNILRQAFHQRLQDSYHSGSLIFVTFQDEELSISERAPSLIEVTRGQAIHFVHLDELLILHFHLRSEV